MSVADEQSGESTAEDAVAAGSSHGDAAADTPSASTPPVPTVAAADAAGAPAPAIAPSTATPTSPSAPSAEVTPPATQPGPPSTATALSVPAWATSRALGQAALTGVVAVGGAVAGSIVVAVLSLLFALITSSPSSGSVGTPDLSQLEFGGIPGLGPIIWLATLGLFGQLSGGLNLSVLGTSGSVAVGGGVVVILATILGLGAGAWWSYRQERVARTAGRAASWGLGAGAGLVAAVLLLLLAFVGRTTVSLGQTLGDYSIEVSSLSFLSFFGPLLAVALAAVAGRWLASDPAPGESAPHFWAALGRVPGRLKWGLRDLFDYVAVITVVFLPASLIVAFVMGDGVAGAWPTGIGTFIVLSAAVGHFGGAVSSMSAPGLGSSSTTATLFGADTPAAWLLLLLALIAAIGAAILIGARRAVAPVPASRSWVLPVLVLAVTIIAGLLFGTAFVFGSAGIAGLSTAFAASISPSWWTYLIAILWGAAVEALARFVVPVILATWPALGRWRIGPAPLSAASTPLGAPGAASTIPGAPAAPAASGVPEAADPSAISAVPTPAAVPRAPLSPGAKRRLLIGGIAVGAIALLGIGGAVTVGILRSTVFSPRGVVEAYLDDITAGRFAEAFARTPGTTAGATALVSSDDVILDAAPVDVRIGDVSSDGDTQTLTVSFEVDGQRDSGIVTVESAGTEFLFFNSWRIVSGLETTALVGGAPMTIGGVEVDPGEGGIDLIVYPGVYAVEANTSRWESATTAPLVVGSWGGQVFAETEPSDALREEVQAQVEALLDECAASTELAPDDCPFSDYAWGEVQNVAWTIDEYPVVALYDTESFSAEGGTATVTYQRQSFSGDWTDETGEDSFSIYAGGIEIDGDDVTVSLSLY